MTLAQTMSISVGGARLTLLPQRALFWRRRHMLIVADIHFGKAAAFRAKGIPVPRGTTQHNLDALDALIAGHGVRHIAFLGDFLHARQAHAPATLAALQRWRERHPRLKLTLVRGNHDRHAGDPPPSLGMAVVDEPWQVGGLALCHHPQASSAGYVLAGHVHPVLRLSVGRESLRLPCFVFGGEGAILPAFGAFTGGHAVDPQAGERVFVAADDAVFAVGQPASVFR
ncbi:MAG TPA: ligase-associated DNA damage response endonuclease PdeM [Herbaspirillum sp.]|jgi:DNA ligase-associated metallophosphoesterase